MEILQSIKTNESILQELSKLLLSGDHHEKEKALTIIRTIDQLPMLNEMFCRYFEISAFFCEASKEVAKQIKELSLI